MSEESTVPTDNINHIGYSGEVPLKPKRFTRTKQAIEFLKTENNSRTEYSLAVATMEKPLTHYTHGGNLLQILRFGLQSNNFKNRLSEFRTIDHKLDMVARQISGFHFKQGSSYQGKDSISMSVWDENIQTGPQNVLLLVNPDTQVWGVDETRETTGYGHGVRTRKINGDYEVGNATAYRNEVIACNIIPPSDIRAVVLGRQARILGDMNSIVREQAKIYSQEKHRNAARANEDMLASVRLLAALNADEKLQQKTDELEKKLTQMEYRDVVRVTTALQQLGLQKFVGERDLTEDNLRSAISERFNIKILEKPEL